MSLVECGLCEDIELLTEWKEGNVFVCVKCAKILEKIKKLEIKKNITFSGESRLKILDKMRTIQRKREEKNGAF